MTAIRPRCSTGLSYRANPSIERDYIRASRIVHLYVVSRASKSLRFDDYFGKTVHVELSIERTKREDVSYDSKHRANKGKVYFYISFRVSTAHKAHDVVRDLSIVIVVDQLD